MAQSLVGQKLSSFTGVKAFVLRAFEDSLAGILNKRAVDVLHDVQRQRAKGRPYVIVFCGVNGVGKSTNLAKIAYWLGQHGEGSSAAASLKSSMGVRWGQLHTPCQYIPAFNV